MGPDVTERSSTNPREYLGKLIVIVVSFTNIVYLRFCEKG